MRAVTPPQELRRLTEDELTCDAANRSRYAHLAPVDVFGPNASSLLQQEVARNCAAFYRELRQQWREDTGVEKRSADIMPPVAPKQSAKAATPVATPTAEEIRERQYQAAIRDINEGFKLASQPPVATRSSAPPTPTVAELAKYFGAGSGKAANDLAMANPDEYRKKRAQAVIAGLI